MKYYIIQCNIYYNIGSTIINHDSEDEATVEHCSDPGCYSDVIKYQATEKQIKSLIDISEACTQSVKVYIYELYNWLINSKSGYII